MAEFWCKASSIPLWMRRHIGEQIPTLGTRAISAFLLTEMHISPLSIFPGCLPTQTWSGYTYTNGPITSNYRGAICRNAVRQADQTYLRVDAWIFSLPTPERPASLFINITSIYLFTLKHPALNLQFMDTGHYCVKVAEPCICPTSRCCPTNRFNRPLCATTPRDPSYYIKVADEVSHPQSFPRLDLPSSVVV